MKENIYYYVTYRNGVKVGYDDLRLKTIVDDVNNFLKRARDYNHQVKHFFDEEEADQFFRAYKKTLEKEEAMIEVVPLKKENVEPVVKQSVSEVKTESNRVVNLEISKIELKEVEVSNNIDVLNKFDELPKIENSISAKHVNHGGRRAGAGRPKGPKTQAEKDKISQSMKGNRNAAKPVNE